ncbi:hypothetical protein FHR83_006986 [Actinoplanes campanulatus]|uniref:Uncharacterized protein n=1 Tax=Actinoplanes campanulatus TaxID=113559 RepID=A0A7W5FIB3_9ACTN|nr:hypothetical protein [Actinoplanes campanulatus]MBB3099280.1 hypothetical protein [Actinoplanes campanulatus]GGN40644.1 hypothetical protein GCM10010109_70050 [Actinoplanes campanulatus]
MRKSLARRCAAAALAVFTGLTTVALAASPAQAAPALAGVTLSTGTVVLDGDAGCANRVKVTFKVYDPVAEDDYVSVSADVMGPDGDAVDFLFPKQASRSGDYAYLTDYVFICGGLDGPGRYTIRSGDYAYLTDYVFICGGLDGPGRYTIRTELEWFGDDLVDHVVERVDTFYVKRPTSLTYDATPEPVKKNSALTHKGVLKADPVGYGAKYGLKGAVLRFYFKASGAKSYTYKGQTTTGAGGKYSKKFKATKSGTWMVVYAGSSIRQPQTRFDAVKVK